MRTRPRNPLPLFALSFAAVFGVLGASETTSAATIRPSIGGGGGFRAPSINITPRMTPNFHYDRIRTQPSCDTNKTLPGCGDRGSGGSDRSSAGSDKPPRKIIKIDKGPNDRIRTQPTCDTNKALPGCGNKGLAGSDKPPRKIIKIDKGPIGPIGPVGSSGPSGIGPKGPSQPTARAARRSNVPPAGERRFVPDEVLITVAANFSEQNANALSQRFNLTRVESQVFGLTNTQMFRWRIPDARSVATVIRALERAGFTVQPNHVFDMVQSEGNGAGGGAREGDPAQYTVIKLRLPAAHSLARGGNILVSVIDSGIDAAHPELAGVVADSYDPVGGEPPHSHGTAIAGAIASQQRLVGAAPAARILAVRAFGSSAASAQGTTFNILKSLDWSVGKGARIINMSFAGPRDPGLEKALAAARQKGTVLIAAVGNAGPKSPPLYPAADPNVIAVSATDPDDKLFSASNRGPHIAVAAPGVDILLPAPDAGYQVTSGTSFAAAYVSGIAALLLERNPSLTPDAVRKILMTSAKDLGAKGRDDQFGAGLVDAFQAVTAAEPKTATASGQAVR